jgi:predicted nucleotidyltransferase
MSSIIQDLTTRKLINPPNDVRSNTMYETLVGSMAYGVADEFSDCDVNGFYIPRADRLFPHLKGHVLGFDADSKPPKSYQNNHVVDADALGGRGREYDLNVYSITVYFRLCLENNPNVIDTLYTPEECVLHSTSISDMVRGRRDIFLHKRCWAKYAGYSYQQLKKMKAKNPQAGSKRLALREKFGFDVKFAYHLVRLLLEAEMIMTEHCIDIRRHKDHLKAIRRGDVSEDEIIKWATEKRSHLEKAFQASTLRAEPARDEIKQLLLDCLEHHYGNLQALQTVRNESNPERFAIREIQGIIDRVLE